MRRGKCGDFDLGRLGIVADSPLMLPVKRVSVIGANFF